MRITNPSPTSGSLRKETYCGVPIRLLTETSSIELCATLGGLIMACARDSEPKLYAMTAGHLFCS